jgi:subtilisin family serine protease
MRKHIFLAVFLFYILFNANSLFASVPSVQLLSERFRTEWNWVEYRVTLINTSSEIVFNPEIGYYAKDDMLAADIDFSTWLYPVTTSVVLVESSSVIKLKVNAVVLPGDTVEIHFRIHKEDEWVAWNSSQDWSYQHNENVVEPHYFMTVYDDYNNLLWGFDPYGGKKNAEVVLWNERGVNAVIERYAGDTSEVVPAGRFWLFKETPLSEKERAILEQNGIVQHSVGRLQGKDVILFKSDTVVPKALLDSVLVSFYNAIPVNDTTQLNLDIGYNNVGDTLSLNVGCWPDVDIGTCIDIVESCGGDSIEYARNVVLTQMPLDSVQCVETNRDVYFISLQHEGAPLNDNARNAINLSSIQNTPEFLAAMNEQQTTTEWLKDVDYTGEGIVVGVYDDGIDFDHPDFQELDSNDSIRIRKIDSLEYYGLNKKGFKKGENRWRWHGTGVAGIIGGNGANSENRKYRGIAPKVHFFINKGSTNWQIGHVVNHSHTDDSLGRGFYGQDAYVIDRAVFENWKSDCSKNIKSDDCVEGDTLAKAVVYGAANNGGMIPQYDNLVGYHSILANSKNAITVGNITSKEGVRFYTSSMGPTWDGRIKPDVMAPGATSEMLVDENHPFELMIDYIKLFRAGVSNPFINLDFKDNNLVEDLANQTSPYREISYASGAVNGYAFRVEEKRPNNSNIICGWKLNHGDSIYSTDTLEIRVKVSKGVVADKKLYGNVYFGLNDTAFYNPNNGKDESWYKSIRTIWNVDSSFMITRVPLSIQAKAFCAYYVRLDFGFVKGVITPFSCRNSVCGYAHLSDGGASESAPQVSGLAALMYQKFKKMTGEPLDKKSMRNSTVKSLIIHSAIDMEDSVNAHFFWNPDITAAHHDSGGYFTPYGKGPDFATGWGKIDAKSTLETIENYNGVTKEFPRFKEFEIANGMEKRWRIQVKDNPEKMRVTLVWDDAPGNYGDVVNVHNFLESKLINDLDLYLVSPSGNYYYPWRLNPLPTDFIDANGNHVDDYSSGLENIKMYDVQNAYNNCNSLDKLDSICFDHLNNVEVVDVENPESGTWYVVVRGTRISCGNNESKNAQVASIVADYELKTSKCEVIHDYSAQSSYTCVYSFDKDSYNYVVFSDSTFVGTGDTISLYDAQNSLLGKYTGASLSGKKVKVNSTKLKVVLESDKDGVQGWGFGVSKIGSVPYAALKMPFEFTGRVQ